MTFVSDGSEFSVLYFDYTCEKSDPVMYNIFVYDHFGCQFMYATVYDLSTLRLIIKHLLKKGLKLKEVICREIEDLILPFPEPFDDELESLDDDFEDDPLF